jgi:hypothetical protein
MKPLPVSTPLVFAEDPMGTGKSWTRLPGMRRSNDSAVHPLIHDLPFGGVGESGMGSFDSKVSFSFSPGFSPVQEQRSIEKPFQRFS